MHKKIKDLLQIDYIAPLLHFFASFFYEHYIFKFKDNLLIQRSIPLNDFFSYRAEMIMSYLIMKIIAAILIWCCWKLFFKIIRKEIPLRTSILFTALFVFGLVILFFLYPGCFTTSNDDYIVYAHAVNFLPSYWFSVYTAGFYGACMMTFPHPFMIVAVHWLGLLFAIGYMYHRIDCSKVIRRSYRRLPFFLFLFPIVHIIIMDAYRTELYCVVCLIYTAVIMLDIIEKRNRPLKETIIIIVLAAFIGVWRTEGIVLSGITILGLLCFTYRESMKKLLIGFAIFGGAFLIMTLPQKVGDIKYYRNDYTIVNLAHPLGVIFNCPESNLSYEGASEDKAAISAVVPISYLQEYYLDGFRRRNVEMGSWDINQSLAEKDISKAFVKAAKRIILHNPQIYIESQLDFFNYAIGSTFPIKTYPYTGPANNAPKWYYDMWEVGEIYFDQSPLTVKWKENPFRINTEKYLLQIRSSFLNFYGYSHLKPALNVFCLLFILYLAIKETFLLIQLGKKGDAFVFIPWAIVMQAIAITLCMPGGVEAYFRGVYFAIYGVMLLYPGRLWILHKNEIQQTE